MITRTLIISFCILLLANAGVSHVFQPAFQQPLRDTLSPSSPADTIAKRYLALGDSYTIGQSVKQAERYPAQTVAALRMSGVNIGDAEIIATSGWTTENLLDAVKDKPAKPGYDLVTLLIGVNNQYQRRSMEEYRAQFTLLLKKAIRFAGNRPSRVVVLSIPDYSVTPFANHADREAIAKEINAFNRANKRIAELCQVNYLDITAASRKAASDRSLIAYDDLHFSGKEHTVWTSLLVPVANKALKR